MSPARTERAVVWSLRGAALAAAAIVGLIVALLLVESIPAIRNLALRLVTDSGWYPAPAATDGSFRITPMVVGTLLITAGAVVIAAPLGLASALFCRFFAPPGVAAIYRRLVELLAGIPGVIYGFWGLVVLVPLISALRPPGASVLTAIVVLALMILPTVALLSESALRDVPQRHLQAAAALGLSRWGTIAGVALPAARSGIVTAVILATGRAIGETLAVVMVVGNIVQIPSSLLQPARALTGNIALEMGYASGDHRSALFFSGLILLVLVMLLTALAAWLRGDEHDHA
jgi:phosphate transport system permease protein